MSQTKRVLENYNVLDISNFAAESNHPYTITKVEPSAAIRICVNLFEFLKVPANKAKIRTRKHISWLLPIITAPLHMSMSPESDLSTDAFNALLDVISIDVEDNNTEWNNKFVMYVLNTFKKIPAKDRESRLPGVSLTLSSFVFKSKFEYSQETWEVLIQFVYALAKEIGFANVSNELANVALSMIPMSGILTEAHITIFDELLNQCGTVSNFATAWQALFTRVCFNVFPHIFTFETACNKIVKGSNYESMLQIFCMMKKQADDPPQGEYIIKPSVLAFTAAVTALHETRTSVSSVFRVKWPVDAFMNLFGSGAFDDESDSKTSHFDRVVGIWTRGFWGPNSEWTRVIRTYILWTLSHDSPDVFDMLLSLSNTFAEEHQLLADMLPFLMKKIAMIPSDFNTSGTAYEWAMLLTNIEAYVKSISSDWEEVMQIAEKNEGKVVLSSDCLKTGSEGIARFYAVLRSEMNRLMSMVEDWASPSLFAYLSLRHGDLQHYVEIMNRELLQNSDDCRFLIQSIAAIPIYNSSLASKFGFVVDLVISYFYEHLDSERLSDALICLLLLSHSGLVPVTCNDLCHKVMESRSNEPLIVALANQLRFALMIDTKALYSPAEISAFENGKKSVSYCINNNIFTFCDDSIVVRTSHGILVFNKKAVDDETTSPVADIPEIDAAPFNEYSEMKYESFFDDDLRLLYDLGVLRPDNIANFRKADPIECITHWYDQLFNMDVLEIVLYRTTEDSISIFDASNELSDNMKTFICDLCNTSLDQYPKLGPHKTKCPLPFISFYEMGAVLLSPAYFDSSANEYLSNRLAAIIFNETKSRIQANISELKSELAIAVSLCDSGLYKLQIVKAPTNLVIPFRGHICYLVAAEDLRKTIVHVLISYLSTVRPAFFTQTYENRRTFLEGSSNVGCSIDKMLSYIFESEASR